MELILVLLGNLDWDAVTFLYPFSVANATQLQYREKRFTLFSKLRLWRYAILFNILFVFLVSIPWMLQSISGKRKILPTSSPSMPVVCQKTWWTKKLPELSGCGLLWLISKLLSWRVVMYDFVKYKILLSRNQNFRIKVLILKNFWFYNSELL